MSHSLICIKGANPKLPAFRVTRHDGTDYVTSMAAGVTIAQAKAYFLGTKQVEENFETGKEAVRVVTGVEQLFSAEEIKQMRDWIADCSWPDLENAEDLAVWEVVAGVRRHFDGGIEGFLLTVQ